MKRKRTAHVRDRPPKRTRDAPNQCALATTPSLDHPVLRCLYPQVLSLRHYLLSRLPVASKNRRRKLSQLGQSDPRHYATTADAVELALGQLLDETLVGVSPQAIAAGRDEAAKTRDSDIVSFSQQLFNSTAGGTFKPGYFQQSETVDFVIWRLFKKSTSYRPSHLLCHGFQRRGGQNQHGVKTNAIPGVPGIISCYPNTYVETLKGPLWCRLHAVLGEGGDRIMMDLLVDCGVFNCIQGRPGNYYQLSGTPLSEIKHEPAAKEVCTATKAAGLDNQKLAASSSDSKKPSTITLVRSRMLYARAALNAKGGVRFGMRHIHVLNRFPDQHDDQQTVHIMRYVFPRQFGLHNIFTSKVDWRETAMPFKDYTLREKEIQQVMYRDTSKSEVTDAEMAKRNSHVPKRLRGGPVTLINKLRKLHHKCSYMELLRHYCPMEGLHLSPRPDWRKNPLQPSPAVLATAKVQRDTGNDAPKSKSPTVQDMCFTDLACPTAHVSAFCRAVINKVIPNDFWGEDNKRIVMYWIDQFICLRRFESLTLHQITQKLQISNLAWLRLPGQHTSSKMAKSDFDKRRDIFMEFVYWVFDSFLMPLIRSNFHVTESNAHRNRLFYFRHDVWRMLTEPSLTGLKVNLFEELPTDRAAKLLSGRPLGFSKIRLLPKHAGVRMITNLKRRQQVMRNGTMILGRSINSVMAPVFHALNYEKSLQPSRFGGSLFSVGDMFPKLASFRRSLQEQGCAESPLYFVKVDVQSCFDTIPQKRLLSMVESLLSMEGYQTGKHVEIRPLDQLQRLDGQYANPMPLRRYVARSGAAGQVERFESLIRDKFVGTKANTIFVDTAVLQVETRDDLMHLLREHVERNLVQIGKKYYRQKTGIPQGSVLSSILCNFFYAELEKEVLSFALGAGSLLLRLLDDFCLITTTHEHAQRFVRVMHRGSEDYGVKVKPAKSLANFDVVDENGYQLAKSDSGFKFPFCGVCIDMRTLEVSKDKERSGQTNVEDSLTVDLSKMPGQTFHRKALNGFKIQLQAMFIDTSFNTVPTVLANLYQSFREAAVRCFAYNKSLSKVRPTHSRLLITTIDSIIALAHVMLQRRTRSKASQNMERVRSAVSRQQIHWLACTAFDDVFRRRQTQHGALLEWLGRSLAAVRPSSSAERSMLEGAAVAWRVRHGRDSCHV